MATVDGNDVASLASRTPTPIAQLNPDLPDQTSRVVRGDVTITWPYNSVTQRFAFLLAEPDVRLRRSKGQIRVELQGPSAKAAAECGIGAGDELLFSLAGAEWSTDPAPGRIPGARVEWQLQFSKKLASQVKSGESGEIKHINVDQPTADQPDIPVQPPRLATPEPEPTPSQIPTTGRKISELTADEYPSPAFVKRARLSYGALFEGGFDIFEEDGGIKGRGRKRTRFGRNSSTWRYSSHSPSPEPSSPVQDEMEEDTQDMETVHPSPKPETMDEGCQTIEVEMGPAASELDAVTVQQQKTTASAPGTPVRVSREVATAHTSEEQTTEVGAVQHVERPSVSPVDSETTAPLVNKQDVGFGRPGPITDPSTAAETRERSPSPLIEREQHEEQSSTTVTQPTSLPASSVGAVSSGLDGPKSSTSNFSFDADVPSRVESSVSLADQVRFDFSHVPQPTHSSPPLNAEPAPELDKHHQEQYPTAYLDDASMPAKYAEANTFSNAADENGGMAFYDQAMPPVPPEVERFGNGQWEMSSQSEHYNLVEGGHFGTDAFNEGARVMAEQQSLHADDIAPDRVPEGFASYGKEDALGARGASPPTRSSPHEDDSFVENDGTVSENGSSVDEEEDEEDEGGKFDKAAFGERIEEGDYDQRNYEMPSDDDEALSEEDEEVELEAEERYGNEEVYDEDGEGEEWDEDEDYESEEGSEEEDYEAAGYQARDAAAPRGDPVVISLLSDSEDEDEPAPPKTSASVPPTTHAPEPPSAPESVTTPEGHGSPASAHGSPSLDHESSGSERHESPDSERHESPSPERHESLSPERHESPGLKRHEFPSSEHDELSSPEHHPSSDPERSDSPAVLETVEADNTNTEQASESIFTQTDVIDFATRHTHSVDQQPKVIPGEVDAYTRSSSFASQIVGSFDVSNAREEAGGRKFEPSPSDDSSGLFVSQTNRQSAPSESSSEGLFISQPRQRSADMEGELSDSGSTDEAESIDKASVNEPGETDGGTMDELAEADKASTGGGMELELEDSKSQSQSLSADEMDQDVTAPSPPKSPNEDASLPDADAVSFTSQVEMPVEFGESEDEHMSVDEDVSLRHANDVDTVMSTFEVEDATASEDDVDMLDAGSEQVESESPERMATSPEKDGMVDMSTAVSDRVVTETISALISTTSADGPLPDAPTMTGNEQEAQPPNLSVHKLTRSAEGVAGRQHGVFGAADERQGESTGSVRGSPSITSFRSQADFADHELPDATQELMTQVSVKDAAPPPTHLPHVVDEADGPHVDATNGTSSVRPADEETNAGLQQDGSPDTSVQSDTGVITDGTPSVNQPAVASTPAENEKEGQVNDAEESVRQKQKTETTQQPTSPTEELDDEALIQEQLSQEQQQSFETEPAESQGRTRTRSSSPDFSVHLARQAVAAKRHKKFAEPVRTSSRIARARSNSLRSNTTNGSPEQEKEREEDPSVSLARAALASPSRRSAGPSTSTSTATFTSVTALKADLNKRLRTELPECVPLRSLRAHLDKTPNVIAVVTSQPTTPARAKGGPREYVMSFHVTDPSAAPNTVVEVQMYRPHKDSLPIVGPGDIVLLSRFLVKAVSKKGWGLRTGMESAWAVWEGVGHEQQQQQQHQQPDEEICPQIRGPPVEDWQGYVGYVKTLREWWALVMADEAARGKLERADRKLMEVK